MKNYLCKECNHNNNGWCKEKKMQGLKSIKECDSYSKESTILVEEDPYEYIIKCREILFGYQKNIQSFLNLNNVVDASKLKGLTSFMYITLINYSGSKIDEGDKRMGLLEKAFTFINDLSGMLEKEVDKEGWMEFGLSFEDSISEEEESINFSINNLEYDIDRDIYNYTTNISKRWRKALNGDDVYYFRNYDNNNLLVLKGEDIKELVDLSDIVFAFDIDDVDSYSIGYHPLPKDNVSQMTCLSLYEFDEEIQDFLLNNHVNSDDVEHRENASLAKKAMKEKGVPGNEMKSHKSFLLNKVTEIEEIFLEHHLYDVDYEDITDELRGMVKISSESYMTGIKVGYKLTDGREIEIDSSFYQEVLPIISFLD